MEGKTAALPCASRKQMYFDWGDTKQSSTGTPWSELVIYELHVRGFTRHPSSGVRASKAPYAGLKEKIPYLKELGINAVELMPIFEFDECPDVLRLPGGRTSAGILGLQHRSAFLRHNTSYAAAVEYNREGTELRAAH